MSYFLYFTIILIANTVGALSGMGGGVIIKPALDALSVHPLPAINFYSSAAVFTMSMVSLYRQYRGGFRVDFNRVIAIAIGSIFGGIAGNILFNVLINYYPNPDQVQLIQIFITVILLSFVVIYTVKKLKSFHLKSTWMYFIATFGLGTVSSLLGIGGGPINVSLLVMLFSLPIKEATTYSILTIFFSQLATLTVSVSSGATANFDLSYLIAILPAAIVGGSLGSTLNQKQSEQFVSNAFVLVTLFVIILNIINAINILN